MDDLSGQLRNLNNRIPPTDATLSLSYLQSRMRAGAGNISYPAARNAALCAVVIILVNISALIWSGSKDTDIKAAPANTYMQTYNMSIY